MLIFQRRTAPPRQKEIHPRCTNYFGKCQSDEQIKSYVLNYRHLSSNDWTLLASPAVLVRCMIWRWRSLTRAARWNALLHDSMLAISILYMFMHREVLSDCMCALFSPSQLDGLIKCNSNNNQDEAFILLRYDLPVGCHPSVCNLMCFFTGRFFRHPRPGRVEGPSNPTGQFSTCPVFHSILSNLVWITWICTILSLFTLFYVFFLTWAHLLDFSATLHGNSKLHQQRLQ